MKSRKFRTCNPTLQWNTPLPVNQNNLPIIIVFLTSANILLSFATCAKWYTVVLNTTESRKQRVVAECTLSHTGLTAWNLLNEKLCTTTINDTTATQDIVLQYSFCYFVITGRPALLFLLSGPKMGFHPTGATRCPDKREIWQGERFWEL